MTGRAAVFLDKDGTLLENVPFNVDPLLMRWAPGADRALRRLAGLGLPLIVVSNQPGVALGYFDHSALRGMKQHLERMFASCGARLTAFYSCPHSPRGEPACVCRKPGPGMLLTAAGEHAIDLHRSWMIGDILDDVEAGRRSGCTTCLVNNGNETEWRLTRYRMPHFSVAGIEDGARLVEHALSSVPWPERRRLRDTA